MPNVEVVMKRILPRKDAVERWVTKEERGDTKCIASHQADLAELYLSYRFSRLNDNQILLAHSTIPTPVTERQQHLVACKTHKAV